MKKVIVFFTFLLLVAFVGCSSISTSTDYDPTVDFTQYKTYMWFAGEIFPRLKHINHWRLPLQRSRAKTLFT